MKMNATFTTLAAAFVAIVSLVAEPLQAAEPLFPDKVLEAAVREELKKTEKDELKVEDVKNGIYFLQFTGDAKRKITNLSGLEKCVNLHLLALPGNDIADLKPIAGL